MEKALAHSRPHDPELIGLLAKEQARQDYVNWQLSCLETLGDREMCLLSFGGFGSYEGVVLLAIGGKKLWLEVEDHDWHVDTPGEIDEESGDVTDSEGVDLLRYNWLDLCSDTYELDFVSLELREDEIHGIAYAVHMFLASNDPHYRDYIYTELRYQGIIDNEDMYLARTEE